MVWVIFEERIMLQTSATNACAHCRRHAVGSAAAALLGAGMACAGLAQASEPAWRELRDADQPPAQSARAEPDTAAARGAMAGWKPVGESRLEASRGGFDVGSGLQVSFGIERAVYVNGSLVVATSISIPDVSHITAEQATRLSQALGGVAAAVNAANAAAGNALAANPVTAGGGSSSSGSGGSAASSGSPGASAVAGNNSASGASATATGAVGLPSTVVATSTGSVATNGLLALIQNGPGNSAPVSMTGTPATVIQNTLNNQSIQSLMTIDASVNTLQAFRAQIAGAALNNALLRAAAMR